MPLMNQITFPIPYNSKKPCMRWRNLKKSVPLKNGSENKALITGTKSSVIVFDTDFYKIKEINEKQNHSFFKTVISKSYLENLSKYTKTISTPSGGYHFYFKYDGNFPRTSRNTTYYYDIKSNGGYALVPPSQINGINYEIINDGEIKEIPEDLKTFLIDTYNYHYEEIEEVDDSEFVYLFKPEDIKEILSKVPEEYNEDFNLWLTITTLIKKIVDKSSENRELIINEWDEWSKQSSKYDEKENFTLYKNCNTSKFDISLLFNITKIKPFGFMKIIEKFNEPVNKLEVSLPKLGYEFINEDKKNRMFYLKNGEEIISLKNNRLLIKSDTGTGKTTSFYNFIKNSYFERTDRDGNIQKHGYNKFISLVSRQLLGLEQHKNIKSLGIKSKFYMTDDFDYGDNIIICADSLLNLDGFDFKSYVVFIDEFNSVIEYIFTSNTHLKNLRKPLIKLINQMITECKFFVGVDADISQVSYDFMKNIGDFTYVKNTYQHFKGINVNLYNSGIDFIKKLKKEDKFLLASDSATVIESLREEIEFKMIIGKNKKGDILDEEQENFDEIDRLGFIFLDDEEKIAFSPKIIYGQDSVMKRPVYCWYNGKTISPPQMVQQIARCRNPTEIHIYFNDKNSHYPLYNSIGETKEDIKNSLDFYNCEYGSNEELENDIFYQLLGRIIYKNDSYQTNKFLHLKYILRSRGFNLKKPIGKDEKVKMAEYKENIKIRDKNTFLNQISNDRLPDYIENINDILKIPREELKNHYKLFIDDYFLKEHFILSNIINGDIKDIEKKLEKSKEFNYFKIKSVDSKIKLLFKFMDILNIDISNITKTEFEDVKNYDFKKLETEYRAVVKTESKKLNFDIPYNLYVKFGVLFRSLTGCITSKKQKKKVVYSINNEMLNYHQQIINYRRLDTEIDFI